MVFTRLWSTDVLRHVARMQRGQASDLLGLPVHPLFSEFVRLRRQALWLLVGTRLLLIVGVAIGLGLLLGSLDYVLRLDDRLVRALLLAGWVATFVALAIQLVIRPLVVGADTVHFARELEKIFPRLSDRLAAAIDFLHRGEDSPAAGSLALRRAVVESAWQHLQSTQWPSKLRRDLWWRSSACVLIPAFVLMLLTLGWPQLVSVGILRLFTPWQQVGWPQRFHLVVLHPVREVARGGDFEVAIVDRDGKRLPSGGKAWFRFQTSDGQTVSEVVPLVYMDPQTARRRFSGEDERRLANGVWIVRRQSVDRAFWFRVEVGDDRSMDWIFVDVTLAPSVQGLSAEIFPPPYTGWQPARSTGPFAALAGSRIVISGQSTKPLSAVTLHLGTEGAFPGSVEGLTQFKAEFTAERSASFWLELIDRSGLVGGREDRWQLKVFPDNPPTILWREGRTLVRATPRGKVVVSGEARDDLGLRRVDLSMQKGDERVLSATVYEGPPFPAAPGEDFVEKGPLGERRAFLHELSLAPLSLQPGQQLTVIAKGEDHRGQVGESEPLVIQILSPEELLDNTLSQHQAILAELRRALEVQRSAYKFAKDVAQSLENTSALPPKAASGLEGALWTQREVARILAGSSESVLRRVDDLVVNLTENQLEQVSVFAQLAELQKKLHMLAQGPLPASEQGLLAALRNLTWFREENQPEELARQKAETAAKELQGALGYQQEAINILSQIVADMESDDQLRRLTQELSGLIDKQREIREQTQVQARRTTGRSLEQLTPEERSALQALAAKQRQLGEDFGRFSHSLRQWSENLSQEQTSALAQAGKLAAEKSAQLESQGLLPKTVHDIAENRLGQALGQQEQILQGLEELSKILGKDWRDEDAQVANSGESFSEALAELTRRQSEVRSQFAEAAALGEQAWQKMLSQATQLQEEVLKEARKVRQNIEGAAQQDVNETLRAAENSMEAAIAEGRKGQAQAALTQAATAEKLLAQLADKTRTDNPEKTLAKAVETLTQLVQHLVAIHMAQEGLANRTIAIHQRLGSSGSAGRSERRQILELAEGQADLARQVSSLPLPPEAALLRRTVEDVKRNMEAAEQFLRNWEVGERPQKSQRRALTLLAQLIVSLTPPEEEQGPQDHAPDSQAIPPEAQPQASPEEPPLNPYFLTELRLLRNLQANVHEETKALAEQFGQATEWPEEVHNRAAFLEQEQERLAQLLIELLKSAAGPAPQLPPQEQEQSSP
ncbi:MAG: hypothetical protein NZ899_01260 [Thermoguttaceae bacterium]|nr:hypothetical protein [Thermoguttaceae bacterium]MDW8077520.1 hypothetical protein [Thermoguttaceae bacterium]